MGQYWHLLNLDTMETNGSLGKLGESLWGTHRKLVQLICAPPYPPVPATKHMEGSIRRSGSPRWSPKTPATFEDLLAAPEIVSQIFSHLDEYAHILRFGLTNSRVWFCGQHIIQVSWLDYVAPWRGSRLICLGDYVKDLPSHLNNAKDLCGLATAVGYSYRDCHVWFDGQTPNAPSTQSEGDDQSKLINVDYKDLKTDEAKERWERRLGKLAQGIYENPTGSAPSLYSDWKLLRDVEGIEGAEKWVDIPLLSRSNATFQLPRVEAEATVKDLDGRVSSEPTSGTTSSASDAASEPDEAKADDSDAKSDSGSDSDAESETEPTADYWTRIAAALTAREITMVLRNLTKKEYVLSSTLAVRGSDPVWGFGRAIMCRVCWSTDPSVAMAWNGGEKGTEGGIHRGVWAGDAFDVVTMAEFERARKGKNGDGWKDVSVEVREEMGKIWESEFGALWMDEAW